MSTEVTVGDSQTYTTIQLAFAAFGVDPLLPFTLTDDIVLVCNEGTYSGSLTLPAFNTGDYSISIVGQIGNVKDGGQLEWEISTDVSEGSGKILLENFDIKDSGSKFLYDFNTSLTITISDCQNTATYSSQFFGPGIAFPELIIIKNCFFILSGYFTYGPYNRTLAYIINSAIILLTTDVACRCRYSVTLYMYESLLYCAGQLTQTQSSNYTAAVNISLYNSIAQAANFGDEYSVQSAGTTDAIIRNGVLYNSANPGYMRDGVPISDYYEMWDICAHAYTVDPLLSNPGTTVRDDYVPQSTSICWLENQTREESLWIDAEWNYMQRVSIGPFNIDPTLDYPEPENVLTTDTTDGTQGTYYEPNESGVLNTTNYGDSLSQSGLWEIADISKYLDGNTFGINGISETGILENENPVFSSLAPNKDGEIIAYISEGDQIKLSGGITFKFSTTADVTILIEKQNYSEEWESYYSCDTFENVEFLDNIEKTFTEINSGEDMLCTISTVGTYRYKVIVDNGLTSESFYSYFNVRDVTAPNRPTTISINMAPDIPIITTIT